MTTKKKDHADRGKWAEGETQKFLNKLAAAHAGFAFERRYDAKSAGGRFPAQAGDFGYHRKLSDLMWVSGYIEVKELEHDYRLPQKNFAKEKIARLKVKHLAGADVVIVIYHTALKKWRPVPFSVFADKPAAPSWDVSNYLLLYDTVEDALFGEPALRL